MTTKIVLFKNYSGNVIHELVINSNEALKKVWEALPDEVAPGKAYYVFKGRILTDSEEWLTVEEAFFGCLHPIVYVVRRRKNNSSNRQADNPRSSPGQRPTASTSTEPNVRGGDINDEPRCRICYSTENEPSDRLFRPCLCRGTVGFVHTSCLNAWRERPENPDAYFRCVNCGYEYRIARARFAQMLSSDEYAKIGAVLYMLVIVFIFSLVSKFLFPIEVSNSFFDLIEWDPPDGDYPFVRHFVFGVSCIGLAGFLTHLATMIEFIREHGSIEALFALGMSLTANGNRGIRLFCVCGVAVAYGMIFQESQRFVRRLFTEFGERVLEVTD